MRIRRPPRDRTSGSVSVEFAFIAPVLILAVLSTVDIGLAIHNSSEVDQALRNGAEVALSDPGESRVSAVLAAVDITGAGQSATTWTVTRNCVCPATPNAPKRCSPPPSLPSPPTCAGVRPYAIFYNIIGVRRFTGIFLPNRDLIRAASVQVR